MKIKHLVFLMFFLLGCTPTTSIPTVEVTSTSSVVPTENVITPTITPIALPENISDDLTIVYKVHDDIDLYSIWIWKHNVLKKILQQKDIYNPIVSSNGEWLVFQQRNFVTDNNLPTSEIWLMRTDGSDLQLLLSSDKLNNLYNDDRILWIDQIGWITNQDKLLFTTTKNFKDSPGAVLNFDLFSLDLEGQITKLADVEEGGRFTFSPNGKYVAVASTNKIGIIDLETEGKLTSLDFESFWQACQCYFVPKIFWNVESDFILTSIPPQKLHYPEAYAGEPAQVWKLNVNGNTELLFEFTPLARFSGWIDISPNFEYLSFFSESCIDGMGRLSFRNIQSGEEFSHDCMWEVSEWSQDDEHIIYQLNGLWYLSSIYDKTVNAPIDFLNNLIENRVRILSNFIWINDEYYFIILMNEETCTLNIATLNGLVTEIVKSPMVRVHYCPISQPDFVLLQE